MQDAAISHSYVFTTYLFAAWPFRGRIPSPLKEKHLYKQHLPHLSLHLFSPLILISATSTATSLPPPPPPPLICYSVSAPFLYQSILFFFSSVL